MPLKWQISRMHYGYFSPNLVLEKTLECPLDSKEIKPVNPKGNQPWVFTGSTDAEAEAPILWPPDMKSQFIGKDPDAGKDWGQEENRTTEDEVVGWHPQFNGHEFEQSPGGGEGQVSLACCSPGGLKESYMTEQLNKNNKVLLVTYTLRVDEFIRSFLRTWEGLFSRSPLLFGGQLEPLGEARLYLIIGIAVHAFRTY